MSNGMAESGSHDNTNMSEDDDSHDHEEIIEKARELGGMQMLKVQESLPQETINRKTRSTRKTALFRQAEVLQKSVVSSLIFTFADNPVSGRPSVDCKPTGLHAIQKLAGPCGKLFKECWKKKATTNKSCSAHNKGCRIQTMEKGTQTMNEDDQPNEDVPLPSENVPEPEGATMGRASKRKRVTAEKASATGKADAVPNHPIGPKPKSPAIGKPKKAQQNETLPFALEDVPQSEEASNYGSTSPAPKRKRVTAEKVSGTGNADAGRNRPIGPKPKSSAIGKPKKAQQNEILPFALKDVPQSEEASNYGSTSPAPKSKRTSDEKASGKAVAEPNRAKPDESAQENDVHDLYRFLAAVLKWARKEPSEKNCNFKQVCQLLIDSKIEVEEFVGEVDNIMGEGSMTEEYIQLVEKNLSLLRENLYNKTMKLKGIQEPLKQPNFF